MYTVKLSLAAHVTQPIAIPYRYVTLTDDGFIATPPRGNVYLEPGIVYDCIVLNEQYLEFLGSLAEAYFAVSDLQEFIRQASLTITKP